MKRFFFLFVALVASTWIWAGNIITYTASSKLLETTDKDYGGLHTDAFNVSITSHTFSKGTGTITFSGEATSIGYRAFGGCTSLSSITIPNSVTSIGDEAFTYCTSLNSITIPNGVTSIGNKAFYFCTSLPIENNLRYADWYLVGAIDRTLSTYTIKAGTKWIGEWAFDGCLFLTTITIPKSVTSIGDYAFCDCSSLSSITIPKSVTSIGGGVFYGCTSLPVENNLSYADTYLVGAIDRTLSTYTIKAGTKWIGDGAFAGCTSLTSINLPNSVTSIEIGAFYTCFSLTAITIPNSVTCIESGAFYECYSLSSVTCYATTPPTCGENCFYNVDKSIPLYVPAGSIDAYKAADGWKEFSNILPISAETVTDPVTTVITKPADNAVTITWPTNPSADIYTIEIKKNGVTFCTLTFNAQGQLVNIAFAPGRGTSNDIAMAEAVAGGYKFTITNLEPGTTYTYSIVTKNASDTTLKTYTGTFTTTSLTALPETSSPSCENQSKATKLLRNGQLLILRDGRTYTATGLEM